MRNRSGGPPALSPNATSSAARCGPGSRLLRIQQRQTQLVQTSEGQLHLGLDARCPGDAASLGLVGQVVEQSGLADAGLATNDEDLAVAGTHAGSDVVQASTFRSAPAEFGRRAARRHGSTTPHQRLEPTSDTGIGPSSTEYS